MTTLGVPGTFRTAILHTRDVGAAARHYDAVVGWQLRFDSAGAFFSSNGRRVTGVRGLAPHAEGWVPYVAVEDLAAAATVAAGMGATTIDGVSQPHDSPRTLVADPEGAVLGLCQANDAAAAEVTDATASVWWMEVLAHAPADLQRFYGGLLQWQFTQQPLAPHPSYILCARGGNQAAGILPIGPGWDAEPRWQLLFAVDDLAAAVERVRASAGRVEFGPLEVPRAGRLTSVRDPQGALYVLIQPRPAV